MEACFDDDTCEQWSWNTVDKHCYNGPFNSNACTAHAQWAGSARQKFVKVWAYSNAHQVELFLNKKSLGKKDVPHLDKVEWRVPYRPGVLMAVGYDEKGKAISKKVIETTGPPAGLRLEVEDGHDSLKADGTDAGLVAVKLIDEAGRVVPDAHNKIEFSVEGVGRIVGMGNGNPASHEPEQGSYQSAYYGLARVIVGASTKGGTLKLRASSKGLKDASVEIQMLEESEFCRQSMQDLASSSCSLSAHERQPTSLL